jgi:hypothetical protein
MFHYQLHLIIHPDGEGHEADSIALRFGPWGTKKLHLTVVDRVTCACFALTYGESSAAGALGGLEHPPPPPLGRGVATGPPLVGGVTR